MNKDLRNYFSFKFIFMYVCGSVSKRAHFEQKSKQ